MSFALSASPPGPQENPFRPCDPSKISSLSLPLRSDTCKVELSSLDAGAPASSIARTYGIHGSTIELYDPHGKNEKLSLAEFRANFLAMTFGKP